MPSPITAAAAQAPTKDAHRPSKSFALDTPYVPRRHGDPLPQSAAGFAKVMCSLLFLTGPALAFSAETCPGFSSLRPTQERAKMRQPVSIAPTSRSTSGSLMACVLPRHLSREPGLRHAPDRDSAMNSSRPPLIADCPIRAHCGPMGDMLPQEPLPDRDHAEKLKAAVDAAVPAVRSIDRLSFVTGKRAGSLPSARGGVTRNAARRLVHGQ